jgi:hypothetical protein
MSIVGRAVEKVSAQVAAAGFSAGYQPDARSTTLRLRKGNARNKEGGASRIGARRSV